MRLLVIVAALTLVLALPTTSSAGRVGFPDMDTGTPDEYSGDNWVGQLGIHDGFPFTSAGQITKVYIRNDDDPGGSFDNSLLNEVSDPIELLVLRITAADTFKVISRVSLGSDDSPAAITGTKTYTLSTPIDVAAGDVFAHWSSGKGSVPLNNYYNPSQVPSTPGYGGSRWKQVTTSSLLDVGQTISAPRAPGLPYRDYFINVEFVTAIPLPAAAWIGLATLAGLGAVRATRRRRMRSS